MSRSNDAEAILREAQRVRERAALVLMESLWLRRKLQASLELFCSQREQCSQLASQLEELVRRLSIPDKRHPMKASRAV